MRPPSLLLAPKILHLHVGPWHSLAWHLWRTSGEVGCRPGPEKNPLEVGDHPTPILHISHPVWRGFSLKKKRTFQRTQENAHFTATQIDSDAKATQPDVGTTKRELVQNELLGCPWKLVTIVSKLVYFTYLRDGQPMYLYRGYNPVTRNDGHSSMHINWRAG